MPLKGLTPYVLSTCMHLSLKFKNPEASLRWMDLAISQGVILDKDCHEAASFCCTALSNHSEAWSYMLKATDGLKASASFLKRVSVCVQALESGASETEFIPLLENTFDECVTEKWNMSIQEGTLLMKALDLVQNKAIPTCWIPRLEPLLERVRRHVLDDIETLKSADAFRQDQKERFVKDQAFMAAVQSSMSMYPLEWKALVPLVQQAQAAMTSSLNEWNKRHSKKRMVDSKSPAVESLDPHLGFTLLSRQS